MRYVSTVSVFIPRLSGTFGSCSASLAAPVSPPRLSAGVGGFSLLELLVVLVVSGILLSVAAPKFERFITRLELDGALNLIIADIYYARTLAVREGEDVALRFEKVSKAPRCYSERYEIVVSGTPERVVKRRDLGPGVARACLDVGAVRQIRFGSRGLPKGAMNRTVRLARGDYDARFRMSLLGRVYRE